MTNRIEASTPSVVMTDMDLIAELMVEMNQDTERANREAARDEREIAAAAGELRLGQMKEAADFRLASGIVTGASKIGSSIASGVAAANTGPSSRDRASTEGTPAAAPGADAPAADGADAAGGTPRPAERPHDNTVKDRATAFAGALDGAGSGASAVLGHFASSADIRAEAASMARDRASSRADERRADAEAAGRTVDKMHDSLNNVLSEKRRAEEAATRA